MNNYRDVKRILVPVPLTPDFSVPLKQALYFHGVYRSEIILMHVIPGFSLFHKVLNPEKLRIQNRKAMKKLRNLARGFFDGQIPENVVLKVVNGELISAILKTAENLQCDMIIIKKAERNPRRFRFLRAENADKLIAEAVCPVLTIMSGPTQEKIKNILIPVDIFKRTSNKVAWSVSLAKKFRARLHIVSVLHLDIRMRNSLAYRKSKRIEMAIRKEGIDVNTVILKPSGKTADEAVLDFAKELKPDMLLLMTHQESIILDNYIGSFATEIIHKSPVPVFSVVPRKETILDGFMSNSSVRIQQQ